MVTAIAEQVELGDGRRMSASQLLQHFLFTPETQYNYVARLSGGERRRLYLCTVLMQSPNFLVLDEPTNDLDIVTLGILEEYLQAFRGCVIVVSHDRYFVDKVADHLLVFCGGGEIRDFAGTYSEYVAWKREYEAARRAEAAQARPKPQAAKTQAAKTQAAEAVPRKLSFNEKRELEVPETEIPPSRESGTRGVALVGDAPGGGAHGAVTAHSGVDRVDRRKDDALAGAERAVRAGILSGGTACGKAGGRPRSEKTRACRSAGMNPYKSDYLFIFSSVRFSSTVCCATRWMWLACSAGKSSVQAVW